MKTAVALVVGISFALVFYGAAFKFLPLGSFLAVVGSTFAVGARQANSKVMYWVFTAGTWLLPVGVIMVFIQNGAWWGIGTLVLGLFVYSAGKRS